MFFPANLFQADNTPVFEYSQDISLKILMEDGFSVATDDPFRLLPLRDGRGRRNRHALGKKQTIQIRSAGDCQHSQRFNQ
jgi:hypothetical protein